MAWHILFYCFVLGICNKFCIINKLFLQLTTNSPILQFHNCNLNSLKTKLGSKWFLYLNPAYFNLWSKITFVLQTLRLQIYKVNCYWAKSAMHPLTPICTIDVYIISAQVLTTYMMFLNYLAWSKYISLLVTIGQLTDKMFTSFEF